METFYPSTTLRDMVTISAEVPSGKKRGDLVVINDVGGYILSLPDEEITRSIDYATKFEGAVVAVSGPTHAAKAEVAIASGEKVYLDGETVTNVSGGIEVGYAMRPAAEDDDEVVINFSVAAGDIGGS